MYIISSFIVFVNTFNIFFYKKYRTPLIAFNFYQVNVIIIGRNAETTIGVDYYDRPNY